MSNVPMYQYKPDKLGRMTSGGNLKWIRELRKLSIDDLSNLSGIPPEAIQAAENNTAALSIEQIERIALAADCHPSSIAFPHWSTLPYEPEPVSVKGVMKVAESVDTANLKLYYSPGQGLTISNGKRKSVHIRPFNSFMTTCLLHAPWKRSCIEFSMSGDCLGTVNDTYQTGPDFDADTRTIKKIELNISHYRTAVVYEISGLAVDDGLVSKGRPVDSPAGDWVFTTNFTVPANELRMFYGLYPSAAELLLKELSVLAEADV